MYTNGRVRQTFTELQGSFFILNSMTQHADYSIHLRDAIRPPALGSFAFAVQGLGRSSVRCLVYFMSVIRNRTLVVIFVFIRRQVT